MEQKSAAQKMVKSALITTIPVMCGYLFMGMAFGILLEQAGYNFWWALLMAAVIYAGTMQYMAIPFLVAQTDLLTVAVTTLLVHFRHFVYGLSFISRFKSMGWRKYYMIFGMTDETYALLCAQRVPEGVNEEKYLFLIALLNHLYWISGCVLGAFAGQFLTFDTKGIDFAMTALFVVICVDQWRSSKIHFQTLLGFGCASLSLLLFGKDNMLIPAIIAMVTLFILLSKRLEPFIIQERTRN